MSINVKKRNGRGTEALQLEKMHKMVEEACKDLAGVSASQVEMQSGIQFYDGITTQEYRKYLFVVLLILSILIILTTSSLLLGFFYFL